MPNTGLILRRFYDSTQKMDAGLLWVLNQAAVLLLRNTYIFNDFLSTFLVTKNVSVHSHTISTDRSLTDIKSTVHE